MTTPETTDLPEVDLSPDGSSVSRDDVLEALKDVVDPRVVLPLHDDR